MTLEGTLKSIHQKFFDPLEYYLENTNLLKEGSGNRIERRSNNAFIDEVGKLIHYFIFNENSDIDNINKRVNTLVSQNDKDIVIYAPLKLELNNSRIVLEDEKHKFTIVDYDPEELFILLNIYKDNLQLQNKIEKIVNNYTENYL